MSHSSGMEEKQTGFWSEVGRPFFAWGFACFATSAMLAGWMYFSLQDIAAQLSEEYDWTELDFSVEDTAIWLWLGSLMTLLVVTLVPGIISILTMRALRLQRGLFDALIPALLPYGLFTAYLVGQTGDSQLWQTMGPMIPIGGAGGLIYWMANGSPQTRQI